jgi:hypothetical protein
MLDIMAPMRMNDLQYRQVVGLLDLLKQIELSIAQLYTAFAAAFPEDALLWDDLRAEEIVHANRAAALKAMVVENRDAFAPDRFNPAVLKTYLSGLADNARRLKNNEIGRRQALVIARDFENTLVEGSFFRVVKSTLPEFEKLAEQIELETKVHKHKLDDYLKERF